MTNEIPEFTQDEVQAAIDSLKSTASDNNGIRAEDIKTCDETTKEMIRQTFNEVLKQEDCTPRNMENNTYKSDVQKKQCGRSWKLPPDLHSASVVQTVLNRLYSRLHQAQPGRIQTFLPNAGPSYNIQTAGAEMS